MDTKTWIAVAVAVVVVGFFSFGGNFIDMFNQAQDESAQAIGAANTNAPAQAPAANTADTNTTATSPAAAVGVKTLAGGLMYQDVVVGTGAEAVDGATISVHYVGTLENGTKFDSSIDRGQPFEFKLGAGQVIQGWEKGFVGMKVGGKRKLLIPAAMAYGDRAVGPIPANSNLLFEVELLGVKK
jgi:peptidylprolyl isomerase